MVSKNQTVPTRTLNNGMTLPQLGFGTWQIKGDNEAADAVKSALDIGYRLIDTAKLYGNEAGVGAAVRYHNVPREEIFVTSKLWNDSHDYDAALKAFDASLERLGLDYLDLYLIHWPVPSQDKYRQAWRALERLYDEKRVRAIGVCNFKPSHLDALLQAANVVPAINQIELHPRLQQQATRDFCAEYNIQVESYSPLMRASQLLAKDLRAIADKHGKSPAQITLRWHIQNGLLPIPKSANPARQRENIEIFDFELDNDDLGAIAALNQDRIIVSDPDDD